jgi:hypothetical protein
MLFWVSVVPSSPWAVRLPVFPAVKPLNPLAIQVVALLVMTPAVALVLSYLKKHFESLVLSDSVHDAS